MNGLASEQVEHSRAEHGSNRLAEIRGKSGWQLFRESLDDRTIRILIAAAAAVLVIDFFGSGNYIDGIAILLAVAAAAMVRAYNDLRAQAKFKSLQIEREGFPVRVVRAGAVEVVSAFDVVVGDLVELGAGDKLPADGKVIEASELTVDESTLTGESEPARKAPNGDAEVRAGTFVAEGKGKAVVTAVGERTEYGRLRSQLATAREPTPLQARLGKLADRIGLLGLGAAVLILLALAVAGIVQGQVPLTLQGLKQLLEYVAVAVTIIVVAVPEGLPVAVTLCLAYGVLRMAREKSLVRRLVACETMGACDVLLVDKTGTLTENRMSVERIWFAGAADDAAPMAIAFPPSVRERLVEIAAVDSTAHLSETRRYIGSPTEGALLSLVNALGRPYGELRQGARVVATFGFTSDRKRMSTLVRREHGGRVLAKGAPEVLLPRCSSILEGDGPRPWRFDERERLNRTLASWSEGALRPLALAYRDVESADPPPADEAEADLVLVALVGIGDPIREEAAEAVLSCRAAGLDVKLVTGDSRLTAEAVARRIGLLDDGARCVEASELRGLANRELAERLGTIGVVARAVPSDKVRLVEALKGCGHTVAVTGDGTNDGPALRLADVGLSMGQSGTEVAREASDIVILDDNLSSIVKATRWGRGIYENVRRFVQFQLTVSAVALVVAFVAAATGQGTPLNVVQLLWVNLIMDTLAALALASEPPGEALLREPPVGRSTPLLTASMLAHIGGMGAVMALSLFTVLYTDLFVARSDPAHFTFVFNAFVFMQLGNLLNCRTTRFDQKPLHGLWRARPFLLVFGLIVVTQVMLVQLGGTWLKTVPLDTRRWMLSVSFASAMLLAGKVLRWVGRSLPADWPARLRARLAPALGRLASVRPWLGRPAADGPLGVVAAAGVVAAVAGVALRTLDARWAPTAFACFAAGVAGVACWSWERRQLWAGGGRGAVRAHAIVSAALFALVVVYANYLASRHYRRLDWTATQRFALSPQTLLALDRLEHPVRATTLFRGGRLASQVKDLLAEYAARGRHFETHHLDPDRDAGEVERFTERTGLKHPRLSSVVLEYRGKVRVLAPDDLLIIPYGNVAGRRVRMPDAPTQFRGEEALTSALMAMRAEGPARVCFALGHGERSPDDFGPEGLAMARDRLKREGFEVRVVQLLEGRGVPADCQVLVQAGPRWALPESVRAATGSYLRGGGKWLVLVEPWQTGGLEPLLAEWGLEVRPMYLVDPSGAAAGVGADTVTTGGYQRHPVTVPLAGRPMVFPYATSVARTQSQRPLEGVNLVLTSKSGFGETNRNSPMPRFDQGQDRAGPVSVAAAVDEPVNLYAADGRREPARILAVGDADFATNSHLHRGANADFLVNAIDWLARREELIAVRTQSADVRRVTLSAKAQTAVYWASLGLVPGLVALLGAAVAWRRRK